MKFFLLILNLQWRDRISTSAFLIGITLQTALIAAALYSKSTNVNEALDLAVRGSILTAVSILLFSGMSSIQNEFRFATVETVLLAPLSLHKLVALRAFATAIISSPAIIIPFLAAIVKFPHAVVSTHFVLIGLVYFYVAQTCYQVSYLLNSFSHPATAIPWLRFFLLIIGFALLPIPHLQSAAYIFPTRWMISIATSEVSLATGALATLALTLVWSIAIVGILKPVVERRIQRNLVTGRAGS